MNMNELTDCITSNKEILLGKPIIRGLRISVEQILVALSAGVSPADLLEDYPELEPTWTATSPSKRGIKYPFISSLRPMEK
jgi:uncharacterized protein (DUF433 family)